MRIFLDQLAVINAEHIRAALELAKAHEILYWIRIDGAIPFDKSVFPGTIFHNYHDAMRGIAPKEIDSSEFEPWSAAQIAGLAPWETELMTMMDKGFSGWPVDKRKDLYYEMLRYWGGVLDRLAPDVIIFNAIPHQVFNFVLYAIAKERGIKTILFDITFRHDRLIYSFDYRLGNPHLSKAQADGFPGRDVSIEELPQYVQQYYKRVSDTPDPTPGYLTEFKRASTPLKNFRRRMQSLKPHIKDGSLFERGVRRFFQLLKPRLKDIYEKLERAPDFDTPYVYLPLHYQPEASSSPGAGMYVEQILMVRTLASALPDGWELYVKEHPAQWPSHWGDFTPQRYRGYYEEIARVPRVRVMPIETNTFQLADHARATATATGTAAWESVLRGKCALIFGYPWFMHAPGILRVGSVEECRAALQRIAEGAVPDKGQLLKYLKLLSELTFPGTLSVTPAADAEGSVEKEKQWEYMYHAINDALIASVSREGSIK